MGVRTESQMTGRGSGCCESRLTAKLANDRSGFRRLSRQPSSATVHKNMPAVKECPLCGATMRLKRTEDVLHVPGNPQPTRRTTAEWICPDCDYYEEAEEERT